LSEHYFTSDQPTLIALGLLEQDSQWIAALHRFQRTNTADGVGNSQSMETPMTRRSILPLLLLLPACSDVDKLPTQPVTPVAQTFAISGTIRDMEGNAVLGATADVIGSAYSGKQSVSDAEGFFSITGVEGLLTLRVWKEGYEAMFKSLIVNSDTTLDITLASFEFADTLVLGEPVRAYVSASAMPCDPERWDERAPCRIFTFVPAMSGTLEIGLSWRGSPQLDLTIVSDQGEYIATSKGAAPETAVLEAFVVAGSRYEIRINSYYEYQEFELMAQLIPEVVQLTERRRLGAGALIRKQ
jgi:hypothetical protein